MTQSVDDRRLPHGYAVELSTSKGGWGGRVVAASGEKNGGGTGALPLRALAWDMARENPEAAAAFHQFIVRVPADRLSFANTEIAILDL